MNASLENPLHTDGDTEQKALPPHFANIMNYTLNQNAQQTYFRDL